MVRVHEGVPVNPLPMIVPELVLQQQQQQEPAPQSQQQQQQQQRQPQQRDVPRTTEGLIELLVREVLGGGRNR